MGKKKTNGQRPEPKPIPVQIEMTDVDAENLIAFGNRANMTGAEADVWFLLKQQIGGAIIAARQGIERGPEIIAPAHVE